jgi:hypothetical protein
MDPTHSLGPDLPANKVGTIETDCFCPHCQYNLHSLSVFRDERLDISVVRCTECGKFSAAGTSTSANSLWLQRLATLGLLVWIVVIIGLACANMLFFMLGYPLTEEFTQDLLDRGEARPRGVLEAFWVRPQLLWMTAVLFVHGLALGTATACIGWHWSMAWRLSSLLLPTLPLLFLLSMRLVPGYGYSRVASLATWQVWVWMVYTPQACGVLVGLLHGRRIGRGVVSLLVPSKPRRLFKFLWDADHKTMPGR